MGREEKEVSDWDKWEAKQGKREEVWDQGLAVSKSASKWNE